MVRDFVIEVIREGRKTQVIPIPCDSGFLIRVRQRTETGGFMNTVTIEGDSIDNDEDKDTTLALWVCGPGDEIILENNESVSWEATEDEEWAKKRKGL